MNSWTGFYNVNSSVSCLQMHFSLENLSTNAACHWFGDKPFCWIIFCLRMYSSQYWFIQQHIFPTKLFYIPHHACTSSLWSQNSNDHWWEYGKNWMLFLTKAARLHLRLRCWENSSEEADELRNSAFPYESSNLLSFDCFLLHLVGMLPSHVTARYPARAPASDEVVSPPSKLVYSIVSLPTHSFPSTFRQEFIACKHKNTLNKEIFINGRAKISLTSGKQFRINKVIYFTRFLWQLSLDSVATWCCEFPVGMHSFWESFFLPYLLNFPIVLQYLDTTAPELWILLRQTT